MLPNPKETVDLVTLSEEFLNGKLLQCEGGVFAKILCINTASIRIFSW